MTIAASRTRDASPAFAALAASLFVACSPSLDWRETRLEGSGVAMMFPCRPERQARQVQLGDQTVTLRLFSCAAAGATFALAAAEVADPARVTPLLEALRAQAVANVRGTASAEAMPSIPGATANAQSARLRIVGQRPDGRRVVQDAAFFVKGLTLFQATVIGTDEPVDREAIDAFFGAIRVP